jgi:hypothetical protein
LPFDQVGEGADAVELAEVEKVDQHRAFGGQGGHFAWIVAYPVSLGRQIGHGDVISERKDGLILGITQPPAVRGDRTGGRYDRDP